MPDSAGAVDLSKLPKPTEATPEPGQDAVPEVIPVATAFLVVINRDGAMGLERDINKPLLLGRVPTDDDIVAALSVTLAKVQANMVIAKVAQNTPGGVAAGMQMAMQQAQEAALRQAVTSGDLPHPGR